MSCHALPCAGSLCRCRMPAPACMQSMAIPGESTAQQRSHLCAHHQQRPQHAQHGEEQEGQLRWHRAEHIGETTDGISPCTHAQARAICMPQVLQLRSPHSCTVLPHAAHALAWTNVQHMPHKSCPAINSRSTQRAACRRRQPGSRHGPLQGAALQEKAGFSRQDTVPHPRWCGPHDAFFHRTHALPNTDTYTHPEH